MIKISKRTSINTIRLTETKLSRELSQGSGINGSWIIWEKSGYWKCENTYYPIHEHGYYDSFADFTLVIPKKDPEQFRLHFIGRKSQCINYKYGLREYLEDIFAADIRRMTGEDYS
jgi:hypothetical protein